LTKSGGAFTAVRTATSNDGIFWTYPNASTTPQDIPGSSVSVTVPSGQRALLIITFSASVQCQDLGGTTNGACSVRAMVGGNVPPPGPVALLSPLNGQFESAQAASMQWVAGPLNAGTYTVKIQGWVNDANNDIFAMGARTLTVLRSKVS
jgi:hypothetical protein